MKMKFIAVAIATIGLANAQSQTGIVSWLKFDIASVMQNKSDARPVTNFPPGPEDAYTASGG